MSQSARPWYGFLYYLLGARGSFFAWFISIFGFYFTLGEAYLYVLNREPHSAALQTVLKGETGYRRWLRVKGVEVDLGTFFALDASDGGAPDTVLIERDSAVAQALSHLLDRVATLESTLGTTEDDSAVLKELSTVLLETSSPRFRTEEALVVVGGAVPQGPSFVAAAAAEDEPGPPGEAVSEPAAAGPDGPPPEDKAEEEGFGVSLPELVSAWRRRLERRVRRLRGAVRFGVERVGLLTPLPETKQRAYDARYGAHVTNEALVIGHRPSDLVFQLFLGFSSVLLLLITGLFALRAQDPSLARQASGPDPPADEPPDEDAAPADADAPAPLPSEEEAPV